MMRFIMPLILIGISVTIFFVFTNPFYGSVAELRAKAESFDGALSNSEALENERDKLTTKLSSINPANIDRLKKLLPDNIDNIRLILEIEQIASPYGMVLKAIKYNPTDTTSAGVPGTQSVQGGGVSQKTTNMDYGVWDLEFSTTSSYENFLNFTKDIESNLRIVDITSVNFSSNTSNVPGPTAYKYDFKIKTYWLKN